VRRVIWDWICACKKETPDAANPVKTSFLGGFGICHFKAGLVGYSASTQLWINLTQDWVALADSEVPPSAVQSYYRRKEQLEPFVVA
jgi:hypothetical protein